MSIPTLGRLETHQIPHIHRISRKFMPLNRHQLKIYAFSVKFNVCSKWVLLPKIKIGRDFTLRFLLRKMRVDSGFTQNF